jgi:FAD:protein FMN transferase
MVHIRHVEHVMGTVFTIDARFTRTDESARAEVLRAAQRLHELDDLFSTWRGDTPISRLRAGEIGTAEAPVIVRDVLDRCRDARRRSGGWFDPWAAPGGVDPTGLVKGWAGQQVLEWLREAGAHAGLVNAAGDVTGFGGPRDGEAWRIGLTNPLCPSELIGVVSLDRGALAVSGTYERGEHIFDPRSGLVASANVLSAAVSGPDLGLADALATALMAGGEEALTQLEGGSGYSALLSFANGQQRQSSDFPLDTLATR